MLRILGLGLFPVYEMFKNGDNNNMLSSTDST